MKIEKMFLKDIDRPISGVIKVGHIENEDKKTELDEYVVTRELTKISVSSLIITRPEHRYVDG